MISRGPLCLLRRRRLYENRNFDERVIRMHSSLTRNREYEIWRAITTDPTSGPRPDSRGFVGRSRALRCLELPLEANGVLDLLSTISKIEYKSRLIGKIFKLSVEYTIIISSILRQLGSHFRVSRETIVFLILLAALTALLCAAVLTL
jgi:hypothetical protein